MNQDINPASAALFGRTKTAQMLVERGSKDPAHIRDANPGKTISADPNAKRNLSDGLAVGGKVGEPGPMAHAVENPNAGLPRQEGGAIARPGSAHDGSKPTPEAEAYAKQEKAAWDEARKVAEGHEKAAVALNAKNAPAATSTR